MKIEEIDEDEEDKEEKDSMYNKGFSDYSASDGVIVINFENMFENVRKFEPEFKDSVDYCITYKARVSYINILKSEPEILESYMILTKKFLYIYEVKEDGEYPLVFKDKMPIWTEELASMQLSLGNKYVGVIKLKNKKGADGCVIFEDDTL